MSKDRTDGKAQDSNNKSDLYPGRSGWNPYSQNGISQNIKDYKDALEFLYAGASLLQIGTAIMYDGPEIFSKISNDLEIFLKDNGYKNIKEIIGLSHRL